MKAFLILFGALLLQPSIASAQSSPGTATMVLITWLQGKAGETTPPSQIVVGSYIDEDSCIKASQRIRVSAGGTPLTYNVLCVPNK